MHLNLFLCLRATTLRTLFDNKLDFNAYTSLKGKVHVLRIIYIGKYCNF